MYCVSRKFVRSTDNRYAARVLMLFGEENRVVALMFVPAFTTCAKTICEKTEQKNNNDNNKKMSMHIFVGHFFLNLTYLNMEFYQL